MRASYAVGLDVGGSHIAAGLVERKGRIVRDGRRLTPHAGPFGVVDAIIEVIAEVTAGVHPAEITGIGWPSSTTVKSCGESSAGTLPPASRTSMVTVTAVAFTVSEKVAAGAAGGSGDSGGLCAGGTDWARAADAASRTSEQASRRHRRMATSRAVDPANLANRRVPAGP